MSDTGRDDRTTRYLMYKVGLHDNDSDFGRRSAQYWKTSKLTSTVAECLDAVCRHSSKDATLLYACVLEANNSGNKMQAIIAHRLTFTFRLFYGAHDMLKQMSDADLYQHDREASSI
jgi:hypothetical protein